MINEPVTQHFNPSHRRVQRRRHGISARRQRMLIKARRRIAKFKAERGV